jgi:hypothetical protein
MKKSISLLIIFMLIFLLLNGCTEKYPQGEKNIFALQTSSCTYCHLNSDLLKEVADPLPTPSEETGES